MIAGGGDDGRVAHDPDEVTREASTSTTAARAPRIVHLDHTSTAGGAELALRRLLLAGRTWRATLLVPPGHDGGVFASLRGRAGLRVSGVGQPPGASAAGIAGAVAAGVRLLLQAAATRVDPAFRSADIVDANTARAAAYGALAALTSRTPFVVHLRDLVDREALGPVGLAVLSRVALRRADGVIANSRATLRSARPFLRPGTVAVVIPSPAGLRPRGGDGKPNSDPIHRVGMLARIDPWKGQALLLEAFAAAHRHDDAVLEFAGEPLFGRERHLEELRRRAEEMGIGDRVVFLGHVSDPAETLARWSIAVQYSTRPEPLGQNVLQYLAAGCATVVAGEGGPAEWVEHEQNGLVAPPRDASALAAALTRLAGDHVLRERLATAASRTPGLMSDADVAAAHAEFYAKVLDQGRRPRSHH
ncbi:glycosyltransferase family 4 protein [Microbacterium aureliae]